MRFTSTKVIAANRRPEDLLQFRRARLRTVFQTIYLVLIIALCSAAVVGQMVTVPYQTEPKDIANPERGLYQYDDDREGEQKPLVEEDLITNRRDHNQTVVYRHYTLVKFWNKALDKQYLTFLKQDAAIARKAGVKMVVRFAYEEKFGLCKSNTLGANKQQVLNHLDQLKTYFQDNSDVIVLVEAGFIGTYGEWYYGNDDFGYCDSPNYRARAEVLWKMFEVLPSDRMIAIRTPAHKRGILDAWKAMGKPAGMMYDLANRIGYHNDGFLADESDLGTFQSEDDRIMMARDTNIMPMLGETSVNKLKPDLNPYSTWATAKAALTRYHWFLISGTDDALVFTKKYICAKDGGWEQWDGVSSCNKKTLVSHWTDEQRNQFRIALGYRFVLVDGTYPQKAGAGSEIEITLNVRNDGSASPFNPRSVYLVLRNGTNKTERMIELKDLDPRRWRPQQVTPAKTRILLPKATELPPGTYDLYLYLPDPGLNAVNCANNRCYPADYAIQMANKDMWEVSVGKPTGYNRLNHRLVIE